MKASANGYKPKFGWRKLTLDKTKHNLDEDGWAQIPSRIMVGMARKLSQIDDNDTSATYLREILAGWSIKADGIELPYNDEGFESLPLSIMTEISGAIEGPLAVAVEEASPTD